MSSFALYCKSYRTDLRRLLRLSESIAKYNSTQLPFYVSVPQEDVSLFQEHLRGHTVKLISDDEVLRAIPRIDVSTAKLMPGNLLQQVVKSQFWQLGLCDVYLCLDSDAVFIRPFDANDFLSADGTPYSTIDEAHDLLEDAARQKRGRVYDDYIREAQAFQHMFARRGRRYSFGPFPLIWHTAVWKSLEDNYLHPKNMSFADAIALAPVESRWYGEALLAYKAIDLLPCQALFKVYHYAWQFDQDRKSGITIADLAKLYCGVIYQSAWERELDWPPDHQSQWSRLGRRIRRYLGRI